MIIPVYQEQDHINNTIDALLEIKGDHSVEIIVVDGDGSGSTIQCIKEPSVILMTSGKGRAMQMNKGAAQAAGNILLFLHADTMLPGRGFDRIESVMKTGRYVGGAFNYNTDSLPYFLKFIYYTSYLRSRISRIAYGDQGIFIRRDYFEKIGGFPAIPILEEVVLMKKIKKSRDKICILKDSVNTSARRYREEGMIYGWLRNHWIRILFFFGVSPGRLVRYYPDTRRKEQGKCGILFFLRYPREGKVKTRLAKRVGNTLALQLYECFILDMLDKLDSLPGDLHLFVTPGDSDSVAAMSRWLGRDLPVHGQEGGDLGERMKQAFEKMFRLGYKSCVLLGSDIPDLPVSILTGAFKGLRARGAVVGPAGDGGYYLIGFNNRHFCEAVFRGVDWGTDRVFRQTMAIFKQEKVRVRTLRKWWDIDDFSELENFMNRNIKGESGNSRTMQFLRQHKQQIF